MASALLGGLLGCAAQLVPCRAPEHCSRGEECLAHRCVTLGADPVPAQSERRVVDANRVLVVTSDAEGPLPPTVTLGAAPSRDQALVLAFPNLWASSEIDAAFLLLEPAAAADPGSADVVIRVTLASAAWAAGAAPAAPSERPPASTGLGRSRPPSLLRVDVTAQLRAARGSSDADLNLFVSAENRVAHGVTFLTGASGGTPRLDVYFRSQAAAGSSPVPMR